MRRSLAFATSLFALTALASAPMAAQGVVIGPMAGVAVTKINLDAESLGELDIGGKAGLAAGVFAEFELGRTFSIEPQLLYLARGGDATQGGTGLSLDVHYLQLPVLLKAEFGRGAGAIVPSVFVGPEFGIRVSCDAAIIVAGAEFDGECADDAVKTTDYGVVFGAGLEFGAFSLQGRYDLGLQDINDALDVEGATIRNRGFLFTLGYGFRLF